MGGQRTPILGTAETVVSFRVTGIGIQPDKRNSFSGRFSGRCGTRRHGGTGLEAAISRELAYRIARSRQGSTFTLYLPLRYVGPLEQRDAKGRDADAAHMSLPAVKR
jgi:signal transduction histidine kinase